MMITLCAFAVLCIINISMVSSQQGLASPQSCADFELHPKADFQEELYHGDWYVHQLYDVRGTKRYDCYVLLTTSYPDGTLNVTEVLIKPDRQIRNEGVSTFSPDVPGIITYTSTDIPTFNGDYIVLETDYNKYTIEVSCTNVDTGSAIQLYIMSRNPDVTPDTQQEIDAVIAASGLDTSAIRTLNIQSCPSDILGD